MARVFISHSSLDRDFVEREIISLLRAHSVDVWYSTEDIKTAAEWERQIHKGLIGCDWFLIVLSPRSISSDWVQREVHWAFIKRKGKIIPVMMEACDPDDLHIGLLPLQYIDFRGDLAQAQDSLLAVWGLDKASRIKNQYLVAQEMIAKEDWTMAAKYLEAVVHLDPLHLEAQRELINVQQRQQLATLYGTGRTHLNENRWCEALEVFRQVQAIDKAYRDVAELIAEADAGLAEEEIQRQERERQEREAKEEAERQERERQARQVQEQLYLEVQEASNRQDWTTAVEKLQAILNLNPLHAEAQTALSQALQQKELTELYEIGVEHLRSARWGAALKSLRSVWLVDRRYRDVTDLIAEAYAGLEDEQEQRQKRDRQVEEEAERQERERQEQQAQEQLYREAREAVSQENWVEAREKLLAIQATGVSKNEITAELEEIERLHRLATTYDSGLLHFKTGQMSQALKIFRQLYEVTGEYKDVAALITSAETTLKECEEQPGTGKQEQVVREEIELKQLVEEADQRKRPEEARFDIKGISTVQRNDAVKFKGAKRSRTLRVIVFGILGTIGMLILLVFLIGYPRPHDPVKPPSSADYYSKAETLFNSGQYTAAQAEYRRAVELEPNNAAYNARLGDTLSNLGDGLKEQKKYPEAEAEFREAEVAHRRAVEIDPNNAEYHNKLGTSLNRIGSTLWSQNKNEEAKAKYGEAEVSHKKAVELKPDNAWYHYSLGFPLNNQGKHTEAEAEYRKAVEIDPKYAEYHYILGSTLSNQRKYMEAEVEYRKAVDLAPNNAQYRRWLGGFLDNQYKYAEAEVEYRRAVDIEPNNAEYHYTLGVSLHKQEKYAEAEAEYRKAADLEPNNAEYHYILAVNLRRQKKYTEAEVEYKKAVETEPNDDKYYYDFGNFLDSQMKYPEAEAAYRRAIQLAPSATWYYYDLERVLTKQKKYTEAKDISKKRQEALKRAQELFRNLSKPLNSKKK